MRETLSSESCLIGIVIPSHNRASSIASTLKTVFDQDAGLEGIHGVYLADDCSDDATVSVACGAWGASPRLTVLRSARNLGTYGNVNNAIERLAATHDWLLFLHDDDLARSNWLASTVGRIRTCGASVATICSSWDSIRADGVVEPGEDDPRRPVEVVAGGPKAVRSTLLRGCWWHFSGCAVRTRAFQAIGPFDPDLPQCADWEWLLRCLSAGWSVEYIPRTLIGYRQHHASVSTRSFQSHRDVLESLTIVDRHGAVLESWDRVRLHARLIEFLLRRSVRAAVTGRGSGLLAALAVVPTVAASYAGLRRSPAR